MSKKVFVCAGPFRSGSTWLYNAMRLICEQAFGECYARYYPNYIGVDPCCAHVVKVHTWEPAIADELAIVTERDWRDVAASAVRFGMIANSADEILPWMERTKADAALWRQRAKLVVPYGSIVNAPSETVEHVAAAMGIIIDGGDIGRSLQSIASLAAPQHVTEIHENHITDGGIGTWGNTISEEIAAAIMAV